MAVQAVPPTGARAARIKSCAFPVTVGLLLLVLVLPAPAAAGQTAEESTLVVDLGAEGAVVEEHTARLLWNLMTDNITHESAVGWNSLYLEQPDMVSGQVVADFATGTVTGDIAERWTCSGDCRASTGTLSWTTTRDTGWSVTITEGRLEPAGDGWTITGSVKISYDATVTADETPSDCGGTPCYLCANQVCEVGGTAGATAALEGWIEGRTLSLAFADRMEPDVYQMNLSDLERTEFFMSRFSITITPPAGGGSSGGPTGGEPGTVTTTASAQRAVPDLPAGQAIPGVDAGAPPGPDEVGGGDDSTTSSVAATASAADDGDGPGGSLGSVILLIALVLGVGAAVILLRRLFGRRELLEGAARSRAERASARAAQESAHAASAWFREHATHLLEPGNVVWVPNPRIIAAARARGEAITPGFDEPLPPGLEPVPGDPEHPEEEGPIIQAVVRDGQTVVFDPEHPDRAVLRNGLQVLLHKGQLTPLPGTEFTPAHHLDGDKHITGTRTVAGENTVEAYAPGTPVEVITTVGDRTLVRVNAKTELWVPRSSVVASAAASATAELGPVADAPKSP